MRVMETTDFLDDLGDRVIRKIKQARRYKDGQTGNGELGAAAESRLHAQHA